MIRRSIQAFTLIETMIVIAIIAVLAALLFPVLSASKAQAQKTDNISKMRQLGVAAELYEERSGHFPVSTVNLVEAGLVPRELCQSNLDLSRNGIANDTADIENTHLGVFTHVTRANYKNTFIGLGEFGLSTEIFDKYVSPGPSAGWLVDVTGSQRALSPNPTFWNGNYNRLLTDGAVLARKFSDFNCYDNGKQRPCRMSVLLFVDPSDHFAELQKSDDSDSSPR